MPKKPSVIIDKDLLALAFDEWMNLYVKNPRKFAAEFEVVSNFKSGSKKLVSDYGLQCAEFLSKLVTKVITSKKYNELSRQRLLEFRKTLPKEKPALKR